MKASLPGKRIVVSLPPNVKSVPVIGRSGGVVLVTWHARPIEMSSGIAYSIAKNVKERVEGKGKAGDVYTISFTENVSFAIQMIPYPIQSIIGATVRDSSGKTVALSQCTNMLSGEARYADDWRSNPALVESERQRIVNACTSQLLGELAL